MTKHIPKKSVKNEIAALSQPVRADHKDIKIIGLIAEELQENATALRLNPYVALKYFDSDWQCFSDWQPQELKEFSSFLKKLQSYTWEQVYQTSSKIPKHGFAYTKYEIKKVKSAAIKETLKSVKQRISEEIDFFELRVNQNKLRVHGFQCQSVFFLVALDRNHEAFPM